MPPFCYRLHLMYDGTCYSGWQIQPNALSIQHLVQEAIRTILREEVTLIGAGRTDAGVHALEQVAHFRSHRTIDCAPLLRALNGLLPQDIRLTAIRQAPDTFHAQRMAIGKEYHYHLTLLPYQPPFIRRYAYLVRGRIDLEAVRAAAPLFCGSHDFSAFTNSSHEGACAKNPVRHLRRLDVMTTETGVRLEFEANGFLYKMVRNMVGMLLAVGLGKRSVEEIPDLFAQRDRRRAPAAAPPHGLFLVTVCYPQDTALQAI